MLLDHSLEKVGGHNYEYAIEIGKAAEQQGLEVVLATHRNFQPNGKLPRHWTVCSPFPFNSFNRYSLYKSGQLWTPDTIVVGRSEASRLAASWYGSWRRYRGQCLVNQMAEACQRLFTQVPLRKEDIVFAPTVSEFDLWGIAQYLKYSSSAREAVWLMQFHFDIFPNGHTDKTGEHPRTVELRQHFLRILSDLADHRMVFLCPTEPMAAQYNQLDLVPFQELPYPVNPKFQPLQRRPSNSIPIRIATAGHFRREKGRNRLGKTIESLWDDVLVNGRGQLAIQGQTHRIRRWLPPSTRSKLAGWNLQPELPKQPVVAVPHPLAPDDYVDYVRHTGIGLFLYDPQRYFARCSGILVEMLAAGVPVIVPAGCWLAEQIAEPNFSYLATLKKQLPVLERTKSGTFSVSPSTHPTLNVSVPPDSLGLLIDYRCQDPWPTEAYIRLISQASSVNTVPQTTVHVVGRREGHQRVQIWIPLAKHIRELQLRWENASHPHDLHLCDTQFQFLGSRDGVTGRPPIGAVGLIASHPDDVAKLVNEMLIHYGHYRSTARQFSESWRQRHSPQQVMHELVALADSAVPIENQLWNGRSRPSVHVRSA
ncbi:MAG: hypothetical protein MK179_15780 [Pirellulaceae bacterium]|nr:hypothetical protein [Pirellulaceae bacterium]